MSEVKEKKVKEPKEVKEDKYYLTDYIRGLGYYADIDGVVFMVTKPKFEQSFDVDGNPKTLKHLGYVGEYERVETGMGQYETIIVASKKLYFENLNFKQKHNLLIANVIKLTKEQTKVYSAEVKEFYNKPI